MREYSGIRLDPDKTVCSNVECNLQDVLCCSNIRNDARLTPVLHSSIADIMVVIKCGSEWPKYSIHHTDSLDAVFRVMPKYRRFGC